MVEHVITISEDTNRRVQAALSGQTLDEFAAEALKRHAMRYEASALIAEAIDQAESSGEPQSTTPLELRARLQVVHDRAVDGQEPGRP